MADHDWPSELGLPAATAAVELDRMTRGEIHELLERAGEAARPALTDQALAAIIEVSLGDPYYIRLLVEDILGGSPVSVDELRARPRGLVAYFDRWWRDIAASRGEAAVRDVLGYLLVARGPLTRRELIDIDAGDTLDDWSVDQAMAGIERLVVGDATKGYVVGHDRFRQYLLAERIGTAARRTALDRLLAYCREWPNNRSAYALRHFPGHLREVGLSDELATLVASQEWLHAHLGHDPSGASFLDGVRTAWRDAEATADADAAADRVSSWVGQELGCALAVASVRSVLAGLPAELLRQLLVRRRWSEDAVLAAVREIPEPHAAASVLGHLAPTLSPQGARAALAVASALPDFSSDGMDTHAPRAAALMALSPRLEGAAQREAIAAVFAARGRTDETKWRFALRDAPGLVELLSVERLREALAVAAHGHDTELLASLVMRLRELKGDSETINAVRALKDGESQATAIAALAPLLGPVGIREACKLAVELPTGPADGDSPRAQALHDLAPELDPALAAEAIDALAAVQAPGPRTCAAVLLAARLDDGRRDARLAREVTAARGLDDPRFRTVALRDALSVADASPEIADEAFDAAIAASNADALAAFAPLLDPPRAQRVVASLERNPRSLPPAVAVTVVGQLAPEDRVAVARRIIAAAKACEPEDPRDRPSALIADLTALLSADESTLVLTDELGRIRKGAADPDALREIARIAPDTLWPTVLGTAADRNPSWRASTLTDLVEIAPTSRRGEVLQLALDAARAVRARDEFRWAPARGEALTALIATVTEDQQGPLVDEALAAAQTIDDATLLIGVECVLLESRGDGAAPTVLDRLAALPPSAARTATLIRIASSRHASVRRRAVEIAASIHASGERLDALAKIAQALPPEDMATVVEPFGAAAAAVSDEALAAAAEDAPTSLLGAVLNAAEPRTPSDPLAFLAATLVRRLEGPVQERVFRWALDFPGDRPTDSDRPALRTWILRRVADALPPHLAVQAVDAAQQMADPGSVYLTLAALAVSVRAELRPSLVAFMIDVIKIQPDPEARIALALPVLPATEPGPVRDTLVRTVLDALAADDPAETANNLAAIAPYADGELVRAALDRARALRHADARAYASASLLSRVSDVERQAVFDDVLRDVRSCDDEVIRCECLARLATIALPERRTTLVREALEAAWEQGDVGVRLVREVLTLAPLDDRASAELVERALRAALAIGTGDEPPATRADANGEELPGLDGAWYSLLPPTPALRVTDPSVVFLVFGDTSMTVFHKRAEQLPRPALVATIEFGLQELRRRRSDAWASAVAELLPHLPVSPGALKCVIDKLGTAVDHAVTLEALAPPFPTALRPQPSGLREQKENSRFVRALGILASRLTRIEREPLHEAWRELLSAVSAQTRPAMLVDVRQAAPILWALGGAVGIEAALDGLDRACTSWP